SGRAGGGTNRRTGPRRSRPGEEVVEHRHGRRAGGRHGHGGLVVGTERLDGAVGRHVHRTEIAAGRPRVRRRLGVGGRTRVEGGRGRRVVGRRVLGRHRLAAGTAALALGRRGRGALVARLPAVLAAALAGRRGRGVLPALGRGRRRAVLAT